jgi:PAS domain S-box-containing protein
MEVEAATGKVEENYLKKELYELIKTDESIFDFIQESSLDGLWYWDLENPENEWMNQRFWITLGYDPSEMPHKSNAWQDIINPDDLKVATENFILHCENPDHPYDQVVRYRHKNGSTIWIRCRGKAIRDAHDRPVRMLGAHVDISALKNAEEKLFNERLLLRTIIDKIPDAIYVKDTNVRKILANKADYTNCGFDSEEEVLGKSDFDVYPKEIAEQFFANDQKILKQEETTLNSLEKLTKKNGETLWLNTTKLPLHNKEGESIGIIGIGRDITHQKEAEEKLILSEKTHREIFNSVEDALFIHDINTGDILDVNDTMLRMYGYKRDELPGLSVEKISALVEPYTREEAFRMITKAAAGQMVVFEWLNRRKNGELFYSENILKFVTIAGTERILAIVRNITERKRSELQLRESETKLRNIIDSSPVAFHIYDLDKDERLIFNMFNKAADTILHVHHRQYLGLEITEAFPALSGTGIPEMYKAIAQGKSGIQKFEAPYNHENINGTFEVTVFQSAPGQVVVNFTDISIRKQAEHTTRLRLSLFEFATAHSLEDLLRKALDETGIITQSPIGFYHFLDENQQTLTLQAWSTSTSQEFCNIKGMAGMHYPVGKAGVWADCVREKRAIVHNDYKSLAHKKGLPAGHAEVIRELVVPVIREDKVVAILGIGNKPSNYTDSDVELVSYIADVTWEIIGRKQAEQEIIKAREKAEESEKKTNQLYYELQTSEEEIRASNEELSAINDALVQSLTELEHANGKIQESEEMFRSLLQTVPDIIIKTDIKGNISFANEQAFKVGGNISREDLQNRNLLSFIAPEDASRASENLQQMLHHHPGVIEYRFSMDGINFFDAELNGEVIRNKNGKPVGMVFTIRDITERKLIELERHEKDTLEEKIAVAEESLKFKQNFLANMSHEIRTPLTGVLGMIDILEQTNLSDVQRDYLETIKTSGENLREIINQVLDYSKIEAGKITINPDVMSFNTLLENAVALYKNTVNVGVRLHYSLDTEIPEYIVADKSRLSQVLNNYVSNAVKFTSQGSIHIKTSLASIDAKKKNVVIKIEVSDSGIGIAKDLQEKLFVPFSQIEAIDTRHYEGTGLGLSICRQLIDMMGGQTGLLSEEGRGSTFWFTFPAQIAHAHQAIIKETPEPVSDKSLRILLAEDKLVNQKVITLILASLGHTIIVVCNGKQAIEQYKPDRFDLILMDIQMPIMDGITAAKTLKQTFTNLPPIVGLSANAFEGDREKYMDQGMDDYLTKPIKKTDFFELLIRLQGIHS